MSSICWYLLELMIIRFFLFFSHFLLLLLDWFSLMIVFRHMMKVTCHCEYYFLINGKMRQLSPSNMLLLRLHCSECFVSLDNRSSLRVFSRLSSWTIQCTTCSISRFPFNSDTVLCISNVFRMFSFVCCRPLCFPLLCMWVSANLIITTDIVWNSIQK